MGVAEDVEVFFPVGVAVAGVVGADGFAVQMALARRTRSLRGMSSVSGTRSWALWPLLWRVARIWLARSRG